MLSVASSSIPAAGKRASGGEGRRIPPLPSSRASVMCALASKRSSANVPSNHFFGGAAAERAAAPCRRNSSAACASAAAFACARGRHLGTSASSAFLAAASAQVVRRLQHAAGAALGAARVAWRGCA